MASVSTTTSDDIHKERLAQLIDTPLELSCKSEVDVFKVPASKAVSLFPFTKYVRIVLLSEEGSETHVFELCDDDDLSRALAGVKASNTAQRTVFKQNKLFMTSDYSKSQEPFSDWSILHEQFGVQSLAAVPLSIGQVVYGVMTIASTKAGSITPRDEDILHMLTSLVAPFAAMKQKQQQLEVTRMVLQMMLPARVVAMISEHLGWNTNSIGNDSSWWL